MYFSHRIKHPKCAHHFTSNLLSYISEHHALPYMHTIFTFYFQDFLPSHETVKSLTKGHWEDTARNQDWKMNHCGKLLSQAVRTNRHHAVTPALYLYLMRESKAQSHTTCRARESHRAQNPVLQNACYGFRLARLKVLLLRAILALFPPGVHMVKSHFVPQLPLIIFQDFLATRPVPLT